MELLKQVKVFTLDYIQFQENLTEEDKIKLGKFVVKANESQMDVLLSTGEMVSEIDAGNWGGPGGLTVAKAGELLNITIGPKAIHMITGASAIFAAAAFAAWAMRVYRDFIGKHSKKCRNYSGGPERALCMATVKGNALQKQIQVLSKGKSLCSKNRNPQKCSAKVDQKINMLKAKLAKQQGDAQEAKAKVTKKQAA